MEEELDTRHVAGIIPLAGFETDLKMFPQHPSLTPIGENYVAIERSLVECAYAGCKTIWVVVDDEWQPIIRDRLGEFIPDPITLNKAAFTRFPSEHYKHIPIFYVPISPKDKDKRDSFAWSIVHGCLSSFITSSRISKWASPDKYYVSSPYAVYDPTYLSIRGAVRDSQVLMVGDASSNVINFGHLGFAFGPKEYKDIVYGAKANKNSFRSYRHMAVEELFSPLLQKEVAFCNIREYNKISSWKHYKEYLQSGLFSNLERPDLLKWRDKNGS